LKVYLLGEFLERWLLVQGTSAYVVSSDTAQSLCMLVAVFCLSIDSISECLFLHNFPNIVYYETFGIL
jgi:hypothetical protein